MFLALKGLGVQAGDVVFVNAHTLTPVPSSIVHCGATPIFIECDNNCTIDLTHFENQLKEHPVTERDPQSKKSIRPRVLLLSHMRSRICDMDAVVRLCTQHEVEVVEDCAHALGSTWNGKTVGTFGVAACFSTQTNKLVNSGEGGLVVTNNELVAGRVIFMSGSYGFYAKGHALLPPADLMTKLHDSTPNFSMRMTDLVAAIVRPQLKTLSVKIAKLNYNYYTLQEHLESITPVGAIVVPPRAGPNEGVVGSSLQFQINPNLFDLNACDRIVAKLNNLGVKVAWFGRPAFLNFTSTHRHWSYATQSTTPSPSSSSSLLTTTKVLDLPMTTAMQERLCDIALYHTLTWTESDFIQISQITQSVIDDELMLPPKSRL